MQVGDNSNFRTQNLGEHKVEYSQYEAALKGAQAPATQQPVQAPAQEPLQGAGDRFQQMVDVIDKFLGFTDQLLQGAGGGGGMPQIPQQVMQQATQMVQQAIGELLQQAMPQGMPQIPDQVMQQIGDLAQQGIGQLLQQATPQGIQEMLQGAGGGGGGGDQGGGAVNATGNPITDFLRGQLADGVQDILKQAGLPAIPDNLMNKGLDFIQDKVMDMLPADAKNVLDTAGQLLGGGKEAVQDFIRKGVTDFLEPYKEGGGHMEGTKRFGQWGDMEMPDRLDKLGAQTTKGKTLAEGEVHYARVGELDEKAAGDWGSAYIKGQTDFLSAQGRVYGDAGMNDGAFEAYIGAQGRAELVGVHYDMGYNTPTVNIAGHDIGIQTNAQVDAFVGAQGNIEADIRLGKDPRVHVGGEAFVGASATIQGQAALGDMAEIHGSATGWAGAGVKGNLDVGFEDGKLNFDIGFGAALGLGFELDWGFSIDVGAVADFAADVGGAIWDGISDAGEAIGDFASDVGGAISDGVEAVGDAIGDAASAVGDAVSDFFSGW